MASRALGMFRVDVCQYEWSVETGEVLLFPGADNTTGIDLLQWRNPFNSEPPYGKAQSFLGHGLRDADDGKRDV